jgi:hypothetical protein
VLVLAGAGVGVLQLRDNASDSGSADTAAAASSAGAPVVTPVQSTKTEYTKQKLPAQVKTLIGNSQKLLAEGTATDSARAQADQYAAGPATEAAKSPEGGDPEAAAATPPPTALTQGQLLRSPAALQECLAAIGAAQVEPVAVDLARYAGREAAIIVLPAEGGGYDVWVVARDCRKGSDLAFDVITNVNP